VSTASSDGEPVHAASARTSAGNRRSSGLTCP
jgi:hypothetical protein